MTGGMAIDLMKEGYNVRLKKWEKDVFIYAQYNEITREYGIYKNNGIKTRISMDELFYDCWEIYTGGF